MAGRIVVANPDHVRWLAPRLRKEDREECLAASGAEPLLALAASLGSSERSWTLIGASGNPWASSASPRVIQRSTA
jgi:hypothetical protein